MVRTRPVIAQTVTYGILSYCIFIVTVKKDVNFMQQAENNIIIFNAIFYSPLRCRSHLLRDPSVSDSPIIVYANSLFDPQAILHLSTKATSIIPDTSVSHSFKLLQRINPSQNETSKATVGCAIYIPSGGHQLECLVYLLS